MSPLAVQMPSTFLLGDREFIRRPHDLRKKGITGCQAGQSPGGEHRQALFLGLSETLQR